MVICGYCRVSTDSEDQINSLSNQIHYFKTEIEKAGHTLYKVYADEGLTGTKLDNRPQFIEMLKDAGLEVLDVDAKASDGRIIQKTVYDVSSREPKFDQIWIKNTSRFARNTLSYEIVNWLRSKKVNIHFITENIDTMDMSQDMLFKMMQVFDENDSKDKSAKIRWGNDESAKRGRIRSSSKLFGYNYNKQENRLSVIPEEAGIVRRIFESYSEGLGIRRICAMLNAEGQRTRNGKEWAKTTVRNILCNEKYAGLNNALKFDTGTVFIDKHSPRVKKDYSVTETDRIEPIITKELFYKCRDVMREKVNYKTQSGIYNGITKFAGLLYCGKCGNVYHANADKGRRFYNCSGKRKNGLTYCDAPNVSEAELEKLIAYLRSGKYRQMQQMMIRQAMRGLTAEMETCLNLIDTDAEKKAEAITEQIKNETAVLDRYEELYARNGRDDLLGKIDEQAAAIEKLKHERSIVTEGNEQRTEKLLNLFQKYSKLYTLWASETEQTTSEEDVFENIAKIRIIPNENGEGYMYGFDLFGSDVISGIIGSDDWAGDAINEPAEPQPLSIQELTIAAKTFQYLKEKGVRSSVKFYERDEILHQYAEGNCTATYLLYDTIPCNTLRNEKQG